MEKIIKKLATFFLKNDPVIIVNTATDRALLCLNPVFQIDTAKNMIFLQFESLNERGGNNVFVKAIQGEESESVYIENEEENILMLQALNLRNYKQYIQSQYTDTPDFDDEKKLREYVKKQKP